MTLTLFLILCLTAWRISSLLAFERGPYAIFEKLREWANKRDNKAKSKSLTSWLIENEDESELSQGLSCLWCNSVWGATAFTLLSCIFGVIPYWWLLFLPFGISGGVIFLQKIMEFFLGDA